MTNFHEMNSTSMTSCKTMVTMNNLTNNYHLSWTEPYIAFMYVTSSWKTQLMEGQKEQAQVRRRKFCAASDQSLHFLSHISLYRKHSSCFLHNFEIIYEHKHMENADLGKHCILLLHKPGFPRWRHISEKGPVWYRFDCQFLLFSTVCEEKKRHLGSNDPAFQC